jgi:HK97 family phage portal protein
MKDRIVKNLLNEHIQSFLKGDDIKTITPFNTNENAMKYSAVFACVRVLSETLASMPAKTYKKDKNGDKKDANDIAISDIFNYAANDEMTPFNFKESCMSSLCLGGNAFALKMKNSIGETVGLYPVDWENVRIERDKLTNQLVYIIKDGSKENKYTRQDIFHIPGLSLNGVTGLTPIGYAARAIELGLMYEGFGISFYRNGANPSGILEHPGVLGEEALNNLKKDFAERYTGLRNTGKPIILEEGMQYKPITVTQADAQFLESRKFQAEDVARIFRVPLHLIQNLDRATNNNIEHQSLEFVMYTMLPWFKRWEENINMQLLTPEQRRAGYFVEFKLDALLRGDAKSRAEAYSQGRNWGWLSVNDIRRLENMNSIENGDVYLQPLNMVEAGTKIEPPNNQSEVKPPNDDEV